MSKNIFRKELEQFKPYVPGKPIEEVQREYGLTEIQKLASNENQLGPSPMAVQAIQKAAGEINFYPEASAIDLKKDLASHLGAATENLVIGNGGEELLQIIAQTFINEGDEVIVPAPSFGIYNTTCGLMGAKIITVPYKDMKYDIKGMVSAVTDRTKLIYICTPNNPTGDIVSKEEIDYLYDHIPEDVTVVLDEAYYEFAAQNPEYPDSIKRLAANKNTVVLRTFSKVCGIAGVRVGYVITSEMIAQEMNKGKLTFDVNRLAQEAARAALKDKEHIEKTVAMNRLSLDLMESYFEQKGLAYFKSYTNFIFADTGMHSKDVFEGLMQRGVIIRPGFYWGWDNWIRVSTGTERQTKIFIEKLNEII